MPELDGIILFKHNSIRINKGKVIYIDPFNIDIPAKDADVVLCTHSHYDHFSPKDILAVSNESTILFVTKDCQKDVEELHFAEENVYYVEPNENYNFEGILIETVPAYNKLKPFHPKKMGWVGYVISINGVVYYIAGDTDKTKEAANVECDVAFLPIGGTYTMNYAEAADLANKIHPKIAIPTHYGSIVGELQDAQKFKDLVDKEIDVEIYI